MLYPEYEMWLYITPSVAEHRLFPIIEAFAEQPNFLYKIIDMDYVGTEPAIWRMMPLWMREVEVFHTRDIDSVPTEIEYRYTRAFENSKGVVGSLRTHENHYGIKCRMLAGLSSFKPQKVPYFMKFDSFHTYYAMKHNLYGSDQDLMIERFTNTPEFTKEHFYDHKAYNQSNSQDFPCIEAAKEDLSKIEITEKQASFFAKLKELKLDNWAGEPVDARGELTDYLLSSCTSIKTHISENKELKRFYEDL